MKITIVMGFFLPMPPVAGGATEKSWYRLAQFFAQHGHEVTIISREWEHLNREDPLPQIHHLRLPGFDHTASLRTNLWMDLRWSWRAFRRLPAADIIVVNSVALPVWVGRLKPSAGKVVLMTGRIPKGQYRWYGKIALGLAASSYIRHAVIAENQRLAPVTQVWGYPIDWQQLKRQTVRHSTDPQPSNPPPLIIGFIGRIHREKGLELLVAALSKLARNTAIPAWHVQICGPSEISQGGSGPVYADGLKTKLNQAVGQEHFTWLAPEFDREKLTAIYHATDIFCLPSVSEHGETFGVAAAEAMASGAATVVSQLSCFRDFARHEETALVFDHRGEDAAERLADAIIRLLKDPTLRHQLSVAGQTEVARLDYDCYASSLLQKFQALSE